MVLGTTLKMAVLPWVVTVNNQIFIKIFLDSVEEWKHDLSFLNQYIILCPLFQYLIISSDSSVKRH